MVLSFYYVTCKLQQYVFAHVVLLNSGLQYVMERYLAILLSNDSIAFRTVNPVLNLKVKAHNYPNIL